MGEVGVYVVGHVGPNGYAYEGIEGYCFPFPNESFISPLYRYRKLVGGGCDHFYTPDSNEIGVTTPGQLGKYGYLAEGPVCYVLTPKCM